MLTYLNLTLSELDDYFIYNREEGRVYLRKSGKRVVRSNQSGLVASIRKKDKIINLSVGKMCYFMEYQVELVASDKIAYKDGDYRNLRPENLILTNHVGNGIELRPPVVAVEEDIFFDPHTKLFILRRNQTQAVYRSFNLEEVISVRNEWLKDKTIHRWDKFAGKYAEYL